MKARRLGLFCVLVLLGLGLLTCSTPEAFAFPSALTTNNTLFMQKFQEYYDYVHYRYNTTYVALEHGNLTADEYNNALSRWTLAWFSLLLTFAYEKTDDVQYLFEAKYFVDNLYSTTPYGVVGSAKSLIITPRNNLGGLLDADIPMVWAMQKLNEYFGQSYNVTGYITSMKTVAKYNNSTDLGWASPWTVPAGNDVTFDEELMTMAFLAYLNYKGIGSYQTDVQKMWHFLEKYRVQNFYPYGVAVNPTSPRADLTIVDMIYLLIAYNYLPAVISASQLQATLNAYATTDSPSLTEDIDTALAAMTELAIWKGFTVNERLKTAQYQGLANFQINNTIHTLLVPEGERQNAISMQGLLFALFFSGRTSVPNYVYGGYRNYPSHGVTNVYQLNNTISYNNTDILGTVFIEVQGVQVLSLWNGIGWNWDAFAYNSSLGYFQGYKNGEGSLEGNDVRVRVWENFKKVQAEHTNYNTNGDYPDGLAYESDSVASPCYLIFTNGTVYSLAGGSTSTVVGSNPLAWYEPQNGRLIFYKINDNSSSTMKWKITVTGNARRLSAIAKKFEAIPWIVRARNPTDSAVTDKAKTLLTAYNNGEDMVERDFTFSTATEGSIKWQLKHYSDISLYTNKNMTTSSFSGNTLTFTVSASSGETSTTQVYCGSKGKPYRIGDGASTWTYDMASGIATINVAHSSAETVTLDWAYFSTPLIGFAPIIAIGIALCTLGLFKTIDWESDADDMRKVLGIILTFLIILFFLCIMGY